MKSNIVVQVSSQTKKKKKVCTEIAKEWHILDGNKQFTQKEQVVKASLYQAQ